MRCWVPIFIVHRDLISKLYHSVTIQSKEELMLWQMILKSHCVKYSWSGVQYPVGRVNRTLPENESQLLAYARFIEKDMTVQGLLFSTLLLKLKRYRFWNGLRFLQRQANPLKNIVAWATDGAHAMCLLLHTEVRWLSKGNCLTRPFTLFDTVVKFLEEVDNEFCDKLRYHRNVLHYSLTNLKKKENQRGNCSASRR